MAAVASRSQSLRRATPKGVDAEAQGMDIAERLSQELEETTARLRHDAAAVAIEDGSPGIVEGGATADMLDGAQKTLEHEIAFATRSLLRERAQRLLGALERLREGNYGICEECGDAIAPARLAALPEVTTCLACQRYRESRAGRFDVEPAVLFSDSDAE
jgi:DnaK suppressor protein